MATATLIADNGKEREFSINSGQIVTIKILDDYSEINFIINGKQLHEGFEFHQLENGDYKIVHMYMNGLEGNGLGREALRLFKDITGSEIYASPPDGLKRDDGSHLTGGAPGFVAKMIEEGLIAGYDDDEWNEPIDEF